MTRLARVMQLALALVLVGSAARAQSPATARLSVTVVDQTNAVIPVATVTVTAPDAAAAEPLASVKTTPTGVAAFSGLRPGVYDLRAEFPGFDPSLLKGVRLRAGDNNHVIVLKSQKLEDTVTVAQDTQTAASDRRGISFGSALTREQIDALSDDPAELRRQLEEIAGPGAVIRVDSFEGAALPPKAMIKSIRVTRDAFAAENHNAGAFGIDIVTQPGLGVLRMGVNSNFRNGALSGRSPFTPLKGPENMQNYNVNLGGPIVRERTSFNAVVQGMTSYDSSSLNVALPNASRSEALGQRTRRDRFALFSGVDHALTPDQTLRISYNPVITKNRNLGIGAYDLPERAYNTEDWTHSLRLQEIGPLGRRFFINTRINLTLARSTTQSALEAPTIRVNEAFTAGGQQQAGVRRQAGSNVAFDLDYVRSIHSIRTGLVVDYFSYRSNVTSNYLGTYTFNSLADYELGLASSFTRRVGNPNIAYRNVQAGAYIQDDIRVSRTLMLSPGVRYEAQSHVANAGNVGPRFGASWSPFSGGRTTLRASVALFYDWIGTNTLEQAIRVDGTHQQELNILDPSYPDPGPLVTTLPANRYLLADHMALPRNLRVSSGVDHTFGPRLRVGALYTNVRGTRLLYGLNLNAPIDGVRPLPSGNIVEAVSEARSMQHALTLTINGGTPPPPAFGGAKGPLWDWKRAAINAFYTFGTLRNNTDGDFNVLPTGRLNDEWGPAPNDVTHRLFIGLISQTLRNFNVLMSLTAASGTPYTIRTGGDDNGDGIFNDRPAGIGRGSERSDLQWTVNGNFAYGIAFGQAAPQAGPGGIGILVQGTPGGSAPTVTTFTAPPARYRLNLFVNVQNLLNRANYGGYSGVLTSPFFGQPTLVMNPRKIDFGLGFQF